MKPAAIVSVELECAILSKLGRSVCLCVEGGGLI